METKETIKTKENLYKQKNNLLYFSSIVIKSCLNAKYD